MGNVNIDLKKKCTYVNINATNPYRNTDSHPYTMNTSHDLSSIYSTRPEPSQSQPQLKIRLFQNLIEKYLDPHRFTEIHSIDQWTTQFRDFVVYEGFDHLLWGPFLVCIFSNNNNTTINCLILDKLGISPYFNVNITKNSQFYPAIENLNVKDKDSKIKKCIAVTLLQKFVELPKDKLLKLQTSSKREEYDPTHAGDLASSCKLITANKAAENLQKLLCNTGCLQHRFMQSTLLDVVYENVESAIDINNKMVFHLGEQLEQLFNPVTEYSPEQTEYGYKPPDDDDDSIEHNDDDQLVKAICNELLQLQTNFTLSLVEFLQHFLITLRIKVLNGDIEGLSTVKLNRLFPPTIDEVTRINCIFLDSLKSAAPYGSLEILKACNITIPYFYKAYTRHEAATKNFSKDVKLFLRNFGNVIPESEKYTEMKLESIIRGPHEKLLKLKLIIDRLWKSKKWQDPNDTLIADKCYMNIVDVIHSFGKLDMTMKPYDTRVFTPSGKILTELAKGWPVELQYKWLKRRVVGVFDVIDQCDPQRRNLLVVFSDYIIFLNIIDPTSYYSNDNADPSYNKPLISDILMNSLINEVPLPPKIPKLNVENYCYIDDIIISIIDNDCLRVDGSKDDTSFSVACRLVSKDMTASSVAELVTKAKILEKDTAFHLFKATERGMVLYSTAHEMEASLQHRKDKIKMLFISKHGTLSTFT